MKEQKARFENNTNEKSYWEDSFRGLNVNASYAPLSEGYLGKIYDVFEFILGIYPRMGYLRFDQYFPIDSGDWPSSVFTEFLAAFDSRLKVCLKRARIPPEAAIYKFVRVKERRTSQNVHAHWVLVFNFDIVSLQNTCRIAPYEIKRCLNDAWISALVNHCRRNPDTGYSTDSREYEGLMKFAASGIGLVDRYSDNFLPQLTELFYWVSYFAKEETKEYDDGTQWFRPSDLVEPLPFGFSLEEIIGYHRAQIWGLSKDHFLYSNFSPEGRSGEKYGRMTPDARR